jgi:hypothetical protein
MVHALREAWRVLKPNGILIDLRPAIRHCRVGVLHARCFGGLGTTVETFDGSRAANRAVAHVLAKKLFRQARRNEIECDIVFDSPAALREWIVAYTDVHGSLAHERLVRRAVVASRRQDSDSRLAARITLVMRVLVKQAARGKGGSQPSSGSARCLTTR